MPDATLAQVAAVTARAARFRAARRASCRKCRRASIPIRTMAAHLIGYVGEASEEQMAVRRRDHRIHRRPVRRRARLQQAADGRGRRQARGRQQHGPRNPHARGNAAACRAAACSSPINYAMQKAAEEAFRAYGYWGSAVVLEPKTGEVLDAHEPAGVRSQRLRDRHRSRDVGAAQHRQAAAAAEPRDPGALSAGIDLQDRGRDGGARRRLDHARAPGLLPGRRHVLRAVLQVPSEGRPRLRRSAPRDREVLQHLLLHGRQHARRRQDVQVVGEARPRAARAASICRTKSRASCRRPSGSRRDTTSAGIRAKRSRWRSDRASCR